MTNANASLGQSASEARSQNRGRRHRRGDARRYAAGRANPGRSRPAHHRKSNELGREGGILFALPQGDGLEYGLVVKSGMLVAPPN